MKFIDFCAGIGGGRLGMENLAMKCVGFSEIDKQAESTYRHFFGHNETEVHIPLKVVLKMKTVLWLSLTSSEYT